MGIWYLLLTVGLCWAQYNPNTLLGRTSVVHLFAWRWADCALEYERYLAPHGFGAVQVYIYVDAIINHMCGTTAGAGNHSTCGSYFSAKTENFPAVPYSVWDFNDGKCKSRSGDIEDYHDIPQVWDCRLSSLLDLALEKDYVRSKVAEYMNHLIDIGVAGFRIDAAKHMWPQDVKAIFDKLKDFFRQ